MTAPIMRFSRSQKRTHRPLCKATFNFVEVSMCVVEFWMISCLVLSSSNIVLQERCTCDFCRTNCHNFFLFWRRGGGVLLNKQYRQICWNSSFFTWS
jgi:hypothetical protein